MTNRTTTLVVYDHENTIARGVADVLADWHASGWVNDFVLVTLAEVDARGADIGNVVVRRPATLHAGPEHLRVKDLLDNPRVRLVALDPVGSDAQWIRQREVLHGAASKLNESLKHRHAAIDLMIPWHGGHWDANALSQWKGWDTLLVAPEESASIDQPGIALFCDPSSPHQLGELAGHAAAFMASLVGLWTGVETSPFDNTDDVDDVRVGRCSHRRLDASALAERLRGAALDPRTLRDPHALRASNGRELDRRVKELQALINLVPTPPPPAKPEAKSIGPWQAIKMFLTFMVTAMVRAPMDAVNALVYSGKARLAARLQNEIFGPDSAYVLNVGGVRADEANQSRAAGGQVELTPQAQEGRIEAMFDAVENFGGMNMPESGAGVSQRSFWVAVFENAFALATGGRQTGAEPYIFEGHPRFFPISEVAPVIPPPWKPEGGLIPGVPAEGVEHYDAMTVRGVRQLLSRLARDDSYTWRSGAEQNERSLVQATKPWTESFTGKVGDKLAQGVEHYTRQFDELSKTAAELAQTDTAQAEEVTKRLAKAARRITAVAAVLGVLAIVLHFTILPALSLLIALPIIIVVWLVSMFVKFWRESKILFRLQTRAEESAYQYDRILAQLPVAVENARRMIRIYSQYLVWAQALSAFLNEPFGRPQQRAHEFLGMVGSMPRSVSCGIYEVRDEGNANEVVGRMALSLRVRIAQLWHDFVDTGRSELLRSEPRFDATQADDILSESEVGEDSYLAGWLATVTEESDEGLRVTEAIAGQIDAAQMSRLIERVDDSALADLRSAHVVLKVGDGGTPSSHRLSTSDQPADFDTSGFSHSGLRAESRKADPKTFQVMTSDAVRERSTRHWLDEVDTAISMTPQLSFGYLELKSAHSTVDDGPEPVDGFGLEGL